MTVTVWVKPDDLEGFAALVKKIESVYVLNSEITDIPLCWTDQLTQDWIQAQINYSTYIILKDA